MLFEWRVSWYVEQEGELEPGPVHPMYQKHHPTAILPDASSGDGAKVYACSHDNMPVQRREQPVAEWVGQEVTENARFRGDLRAKTLDCEENSVPTYPPPCHLIDVALR